MEVHKAQAYQMEQEREEKKEIQINLVKFVELVEMNTIYILSLDFFSTIQEYTNVNII